MSQDDAILVERVLAGEKSAFAQLIDRHRSEAATLARRILGEAAEAEDVVQEALLQAFLGLGSLRTPDRFGAWVLGIVVDDDSGTSLLDFSTDRWVQRDDPDFTPQHETPRGREL